ncbi:hypothetical protein J6590_068814 [Homalodisca vitripennis]|nr:hypothetical protein J6590_068814 [Homalodisca vitripennis]
MVMGSVACIEDRASLTKLGLGVPAGVFTVLAAERWKSVSSGDTLVLGLGLGCSVSEPVPNTEKNEGTSDEDGPVTKKTGFALFSSYNSVVEVDNNATTYILVDPKQLKQFLGRLACPQCKSVGQVAIETKCINGHAISYSVTCSECEFSDQFDTSIRIQDG